MKLELIPTISTSLKSILVFLVISLLLSNCNSDVVEQDELHGVWVATSNASKDIFYRPPLVIHVEGDSMSLSEYLGRRNYYSWTRDGKKITYKNEQEESHFTILDGEGQFYTVQLPTGDTLKFEKINQAAYTDKGEVEALLERQTFELDIPNLGIRMRPLLMSNSELYYLANEITVDSSTMTADTLQMMEIAQYSLQTFSNTTFIEFQQLPNMRTVVGYIDENSDFNCKGYCFIDGEKHDFTLNTVGSTVDTAALTQQILGEWKSEKQNLILTLNEDRTYSQGELTGNWQMDETGQIITLSQLKPIVLGYLKNTNTLTCTNLSEFNNPYITFQKVK